MIMKKNYLKPEAEILDFVVTNMIAASLGEGGENEDASVNKHRGEWGNVWAN